MPGRVPIGACLNCGEPISVGDSGLVYPSCECMGRRQLSQEEAPAYVRVRLATRETEEILTRVEASVGRTQETLRRIRIASDRPPAPGVRIGMGIVNPRGVAPEVPAETSEVDRECAEALDRVMAEVQQPDSRFEAILEDDLLLPDDLP